MKTTGMILGMVVAMLVFAPAGFAVTLGDPDVVINGELNVDNGTLFVDNNNNRIGVSGVTNPSFHFHLRRFMSGQIGPDFMLQNNAPNGIPRFMIKNTARQWTWQVVEDGRFSLIGTNGAGNAIVVGGTGNVGIRNANPQVALEITGDMRASGTGTVAILEITGGSDLSEQFKVSSPDMEVRPGMVVSISTEKPGELVVSTTPYDRKVAGIISGAGGLNTGMIMGQNGSIANGDHPVALTGRVYVHADATFGAIAPGDALTTSPTPGHAMKVVDFSQASGTMIGKAMTSLAKGERGLVLVLVNLH